MVQHYETHHDRADECSHAGVGVVCAPCLERFQAHQEPTSLLSLLRRGTADPHLNARSGLQEILRPEAMPDMDAAWRQGVIEALVPTLSPAPGVLVLRVDDAAQMRALARDWHTITSLVDPQAEFISDQCERWSIGCPYTPEYIAVLDAEGSFPLAVTMIFRGRHEVVRGARRAEAYTDPWGQHAHRITASTARSTMDTTADRPQAQEGSA